MRALRLSHLTVLALRFLFAEQTPSAPRKIAKPLLATWSQSCILEVHSIRRFTKLPFKSRPH